MSTLLRARAGFTLIEILIAIAIVAILGAVTIPYLTGYIARTRMTSAQQSLKNINLQLEQFNLDVGMYPESLKDLVRRPTNEEMAKKWIAAYIKDEKSLTDPWGNKYQYQLTPDQEHAYELFSYGPSGRGSREGRISVWDL